MSVASSFQKQDQNPLAAIHSAGADNLVLSRRNTTGAEADGHRPWGSGLFGLPDIDAWVQDQIVLMQETVTVLLRQLPAKAEGELTLIVGPEGNITAVGDHPYRHALLDYFNSRPELLDDFANLAVTAGFLRAADDSLEFRKAYHKNPEAAISQYQHLLRKYTFGLHILGGFVNPTYYEPATTPATPVPSGTDQQPLLRASSLNHQDRLEPRGRIART